MSKTYSFVAKAPCTFPLCGDVKRVLAGDTLLLNENEARLVQEPSFKYRNHLALVGQVSAPQQKPETLIMPVVDQEGMEQLPTRTQAPVELQYNNTMVPLDQTKFDTEQKTTSLEPTYATIETPILPQPEPPTAAVAAEVAQEKEEVSKEIEAQKEEEAAKQAEAEKQAEIEKAVAIATEVKAAEVKAVSEQERQQQVQQSEVMTEPSSGTVYTEASSTDSSAYTTEPSTTGTVARKKKSGFQPAV